MSHDQQQHTVTRAAETLRSIAGDLERTPNPGEDHVQFERRIAERLREVAEMLDHATDTGQLSLFDDTAG
jgi:hypothetical protein